MISYQLTEFGQPLECKNYASPNPRGDEVLLRVHACGVCHSDVHLCDGFFDLGQGRQLDLSKGRALPLTLGHEISGEVIGMGSSCRGITVGDQRVVYPWVGCGTCGTCVTGDEHLCPSPRSIGVVRDGGFSDHVIVPHPRYLFDLSTIDPTLACTYACSGLTAYSALMKVRRQADGKHVLLIGAGGAGLAALSLARVVLDAGVVVADIDATRREAARVAGADQIVDSSLDGAPKLTREITEGGPVAVVDFVGSEASVKFGLGSMRAGGTLIIVGLFGGRLPMSLPLFPLKQLTVGGSFVGSLNEMSALSDLIQSQQVSPLPLRIRPLAEAQAALNELRDGVGIGRSVLNP